MQQSIRDAYTYAKKWLGLGQVANYIPQLASVDIHQLAIAMTTVDGTRYHYGDSEVNFTLQSIAKVIILATALEDVGTKNVFDRVGMEPTGDPFNSIRRLETLTHMPLNPMINAGAISVISTITGNHDTVLQKILIKAKQLLGSQEIVIDQAVYQSEKLTGDRNRALAYMMKSNGVFTNDVPGLLDIYFSVCSMLGNSRQIAHLGAVLANHGSVPKTGQVVVAKPHVKIICALMAMAGMYDASGEYAVKVGMPSKSGVGGGIVAIAPGKMGVGVFSPGLDIKGNSFCGIKALEHISAVHNLSVYSV